MSVGRWLRWSVVASLAGGATVWGAATGPAASGERTIDITSRSKIVTRTTGAFATERDKGRCVLVAFAMFPDLAATGYSVVAKGLTPSRDVRGGGPPFPDDVYEMGDGRGGTAATFTVPGGNHWFPVYSSSSGQGCGEGTAYVNSHFSIASATATLAGKQRPVPPKIRKQVKSAEVEKSVKKCFLKWDADPDVYRPQVPVVDFAGAPKNAYGRVWALEGNKVAWRVSKGRQTRLRVGDWVQLEDTLITSPGTVLAAAAIAGPHLALNRNTAVRIHPDGRWQVTDTSAFRKAGKVVEALKKEDSWPPIRSYGDGCASAMKG